MRAKEFITESLGLNRHKVRVALWHEWQQDAWAGNEQTPEELDDDDFNDFEKEVDHIVAWGNERGIKSAALAVAKYILAGDQNTLTAINGGGHLAEARQAPLYHNMTEQKAQYVFTKDAMPARWTHNIPNFGKVSGNSFTRNKFLQQEQNSVVRLTVDQARLAQTHKIIPLNAELIHGFTQHNDFLNDIDVPPEPLSQYQARKEQPDDRSKPDKDRFDEEFVIGDIKQLHRYVTQIDIWGDLNYAEDQGRFLIAMMKYAKKFNIPVNIPENAKKFVNAVLSKKKKAQ